MSYFEDQYEAWMDGGCEGEITEINPTEYWADKISSCLHKKIKIEQIERDNGTKYRARVCQNCKVIL